jgi:hypothetical protein
MLTPKQRSEIKRHLGYPLISAVETLRSGMLPSGPDDLTFALEKAFDNILPESEAIVRDLYLPQLECIEGQIADQRGDLAVLAVGATQLAGPQGMSSVYDEYRRWAQKLADLFGVPMYRHSQFHHEIGTFSGRVIEQC